MTVTSPPQGPRNIPKEGGDGRKKILKASGQRGLQKIVSSLNDKGIIPRESLLKARP